LEAQTESLRISESRLRQNQTELEQTNTQLEDKAAALEESALNLEAKQSILDNQNRALRVAQHELEQQAEALTRANHYKSEFLANMSHELRTPLNSLLILARILLDNDEGNLTEEQVEFANIIYGAGTDLLTLINDILDLSKVEAGSLLFEFKPMALPDLEAAMRAQFSHVAEDKGLAFKIELASDLPETIETDEQRVKQIIRNLLSNAFKFTDQGSVTLRISRPAEAIQLGLNKRPPAQVIALSVIDTGIGITADQQEIVFEAFKQADTGSSRQYGGTGLGLTISRELAARLGGKIEVTSQPDQGSCFTLFLPVNGQGPVSDVLPPRAQSQAETSLARTANHIPSALPTPATSTAVADDRDSLQAGEKILLVIDDDPQFAKVVYDFAHKQSFRCLIAGDGTSGLMLVDRYQPDALILDLHLPDISGWEVMAVLKHNPATRHIPVHIISADEEVVEAYRKGAMGFLTKPISAEDLVGSGVGGLNFGQHVHRALHHR
jgi:signal transduction histidine kinase/CheY-like chemotaxis protein